MDDDSQTQIGRVLSRYPIILVILGGLIGAVAFGSWVGSGDFKKVGLIIAGMATAVAVMQLGSKYWLLIPFAFTFQLQAIPIGFRTVKLPEIVICVCVATFIARYALKLQPFTLFRSSHVPVMLYIGWAALIFILHPVGLAAGGATVGGARYYVKLLMAFASFLVMANQNITNRDCLWIVALVIIGSFFYTAQNILVFFFGHTYGGYSEAALVDPDSIYTWQQNLVIVPLVVLPILFARFRGSEMFSVRRPWILPILTMCVLVTLLSGKRMGIISIPVCAISAAIIRKEWGFLMMWVGGALLAMALLILGHGNVFKLPLTVQRTLSWVPAQWDSQLSDYQGGADPFRKRMNELAMDRIKRDPWVGRGYEVDLKMVSQVQNAATPALETICLSLAIGSQWHNTWLGHAADFGIPASVFQAIIWRLAAAHLVQLRIAPGTTRFGAAAQRRGRAKAQDLLPAEPADGGQPVLRVRGADQDRRGGHCRGQLPADQSGARFYSPGLHLRPVRRPGRPHGRRGKPLRARVRLLGRPDLLRRGAGLSGAPGRAEGRFWRPRQSGVGSLPPFTCSAAPFASPGLTASPPCRRERRQGFPGFPHPVGRRPGRLPHPAS